MNDELFLLAREIRALSDRISRLETQEIPDVTGAGTIATGGYTLTVPATGTAALLGTAQTFTAAQTANLLVLGDGSELTISGGVVTVTASRHRIDTESDDATDDLDTINGGTTGQLLILRSANAARDPTLKHNTGNILLSGAADYTLSGVNDTIFLMYTGTFWLEIGRGDNA